MNLKGGYKIISLMAITLIAGAVGDDRTAITDEGILEQLDSLKEFLDNSKELKPILLRVKDSRNEVVMANLSKRVNQDILYINADLVDASLNIMVKFAQDEDTQEIYIDEAGYLYIANVDNIENVIENADEGTIVDVLGLDEDGQFVKGAVSGGTKLYKHEIICGGESMGDSFIKLSIINNISTAINLKNNITTYFNNMRNGYVTYVGVIGGTTKNINGGRVIFVGTTSPTAEIIYEDVDINTPSIALAKDTCFSLTNAYTVTDTVTEL